MGALGIGERGGGALGISHHPTPYPAPLESPQGVCPGKGPALQAPCVPGGRGGGIGGGECLSRAHGVTPRSVLRCVHAGRGVQPWPGSWGAALARTCSQGRAVHPGGCRRTPPHTHTGTRSQPGRSVRCRQRVLEPSTRSLGGCSEPSPASPPLPQRRAPLPTSFRLAAHGRRWWRSPARPPGVLAVRPRASQGETRPGVGACRI